MIVHVRFAPKATIADQNVIRRFVPKRTWPGHFVSRLCGGTRCCRPQTRSFGLFVTHSAYGGVSEPQRILFSVHGHLHETCGKPPATVLTFRELKVGRPPVAY
jgi:hypothetical protein